MPSQFKLKENNSAMVQLVDLPHSSNDLDLFLALGVKFKRPPSDCVGFHPHPKGVQINC